MSTDPDPHDRRTSFATIGLVLLPILCCALVPLLITAGALGALGSVLGNPWVIGTAVLLANGALAWRLRHHSRRAPNHIEEP